MVKVNIFGVPLQIRTKGNKAFLSNVPSNMPSEKQREVRERFKEAVGQCRGKNRPEFTACMADKLTVQRVIEENVEGI